MNRPAWLTLAPTSGSSGLYHSWSSVSCGFLGTCCPESSAPAAAASCIHTPLCVILTATRYRAVPEKWATPPPPQEAASSYFPMGLRSHRGSKIPCLEVSRTEVHSLLFYTNSFWHGKPTALACVHLETGKQKTKSWAIRIPWIGSEEERNVYTVSSINWTNSEENIWFKQLMARGKEVTISKASGTLFH